jgi:integrase
MLTAKKVERAKAGKYRDGHGLYLHVRNANNKGWWLRYERADDREGHEGKRRERWYSIGPTHIVTLKMARERARAAKLLLLDGIDPIEHRKAQRAAAAAKKASTVTFKEAAQKYYEQHERKWGNRRHAGQFLSTLRDYVFPVIGNMSVADIDTAHVLRVLEPHWLTKTETMNRTRGRIERVLDWCKVRGHRSGDNPAAWKGHLAEVLPARSQVQPVEHRPALPHAEIADFFLALKAREGMAARALEFTIRTCARTNEVLGAVWPEIDWNARLWRVPASRMKSGVEWRCALSQGAIDLLRSLPKEAEDGFIFVGSRPGAGLSPQGMTQVLRRMGRTDISVHGFRSTFRDWAAEQTNFPREVAELALAHRVADKTERAYQRADMLKKRHALAEAWSKYASTPLPAAAQEPGKVVPMHEAARA